jgi:ElaB/YqjD/DUF883 family membrane-anchored ribosome-binding protein
MGHETGVDETRTHALRRDIAHTERDMGETIQEIRRRMSPRYVMDQTKESVRRTSVSTSQTVMSKVKENPIPAAMVGVGLWLLFRGSDHEGDGRMRYTNERDFGRFDLDDEPSTVSRARAKASHAVDEARDKASHLADSAREKVSDVADTTREKVTEMADSTRETASRVADVARQKAYQARQQTHDLMRDSPLVAGLAAVALGAILAAAIPETEAENELLGEKRDHMLEQAKDLAREGVDKAKRVASAAAESVKNETRSPSPDTAANMPQFR